MSSNYLPVDNANRPKAAFTYTPVSGYAPLTVAFTDASTPGSGAHIITTWDWDFGDGTTSTSQNPTHIFTPHSTYNVVLRVTNDIGMSAIQHQVVSTSYMPSSPPVLGTVNSGELLVIARTPATRFVVFVHADGTLETLEGGDPGVRAGNRASPFALGTWYQNAALRTIVRDYPDSGSLWHYKITQPDPNLAAVTTTKTRLVDSGDEGMFPYQGYYLCQGSSVGTPYNPKYYDPVVDTYTELSVSGFTYNGAPVIYPTAGVQDTDGCYLKVGTSLFVITTTITGPASSEPGLYKLTGTFPDSLTATWVPYPDLTGLSWDDTGGSYGGIQNNVTPTSFVEYGGYGYLCCNVRAWKLGTPDEWWGGLAIFRIDSVGTITLFREELIDQLDTSPYTTAYQGILTIYNDKLLLFRTKQHYHSVGGDPWQGLYLSTYNGSTWTEDVLSVLPATERASMAYPIYAGTGVYLATSGIAADSHIYMVSEAAGVYSISSALATFPVATYSGVVEICQ